MKHIIILLVLIVFGSCQNSSEKFDASGIFEADEVIISAETAGKLTAFNIREGDYLSAGQKIGEVDCKGISLQKEQVEATIAALYEKEIGANPQLDLLKEQLEAQNLQVATLQQQLTVLQKEQMRVENLVKSKAAPSKSLDDINGQIDILKKQIASAEGAKAVILQQMDSYKRTVATQNKAILSEQKPLEKRVAQLDDQLGRCLIVNPLKGTVLIKYAEAFEMAAPGKALYKIADLDTMTLRAYISGNQLAQVKLNQNVGVMVDDGKGGYRKLAGRVSWIASDAEFTPKTIQTKDERANLVYAMKVEVPNDGYLKIGMYGEVVLNDQPKNDE